MLVAHKRRSYTLKNVNLSKKIIFKPAVKLEVLFEYEVAVEVFGLICFWLFWPVFKYLISSLILLGWGGFAFVNVFVFSDDNKLLQLSLLFWASGENVGAALNEILDALVFDGFWLVKVCNRVSSASSLVLILFICWLWLSAAKRFSSLVMEIFSSNELLIFSKFSILNWKFFVFFRHF